MNHKKRIGTILGTFLGMLLARFVSILFIPICIGLGALYDKLRN